MDEKQKNPRSKTNQRSEELNLLQAYINTTELVEMTKWGGSVYTISGKHVMGLGGFKSYVGIWFWNGVFLKDEHKVLVSANEGVTRGLRQWRFHSRDSIVKNENLILKYIHEAIANEKAGLSVRPEKKAAIVSELLNDAIAKDASLGKAFAVFSPYKQREFLEYIESAKQEKTKITRLQKIKPMILDHVGLNDKYK